MSTGNDTYECDKTNTYITIEELNPHLLLYQVTDTINNSIYILNLLYYPLELIKILLYKLIISMPTLFVT